MAMASSAKFTSSVAALLLVLAVVAGTCASGAYGVTIEVDVSTCKLNADVTIYLNGKYPLGGVPLSVVAPVEVDLSSLVDPLYVKIQNILYKVADADLQKLLGVTGLVQLVIACESCGGSTYPSAIAIVAKADVLGVVTASVVVCVRQITL